MKKKSIRKQIYSMTLIVTLVLSALLIIIPIVSGQQPNLIMNCGNQAILNFPFDVDLNGPSSQLEGLKFAYKPPGATEFIITTEFEIDNEPGLPGERYVTDAGGDCDIDVIFTQIGVHEVKWIHPATGAESNIVNVNVLEEVSRETYAYIGAMPNPVGVNQEVLLHIGIPAYTTNVNEGWTDLTVSVKDPQGGTTTLGPYTTDSTGGTGGVFTPTMVGTYELQTSFPEQYRSDGTTMKASVSEILELEVIADPIPEYPGHSLPTEYWTRPIDSQLREWKDVAGNWPTTLAFETGWGAYKPYNDGPETAHVLWAKPHGLGGLVGGELGDHAIGDGDAYEGLYTWPTILNGILFYNDVVGRGSSRTEQNVVAIDIHTGEQLWKRPLTTPDGDVVRLDFGQIFYWDSYNYHGAHAYLWADEGRNWYAFDPYNGRWLYTMTNVPANAGPSYLGGLADNTIIGPKGEILAYSMDMGSGTLMMWNSSRVVSNQGSWRPHGNTYDCSWDSARNGGWEWNVTIPQNLPGGPEEYILNDRVIGSNETNRISYVDAGINLWAISLKPGEEGKLLFQETWQPPSGNIGVMYGKASPEDEVFTFWARETRELYGFNYNTGKNIWGPSETMDYMTIYTIEQHFAYNKLFITPRVVGDCYCLDPKTGDTIWKYQVTDHYNEYLFTTMWGVRTQFITDGKIYIGHDEHSPVDPKPRGAPYVCLDVETGEVIWRADGLIRQSDWGGRSAIADSIIVSQCTYDQRVYALGKGPSEITVEAPLTSSAWGEKIILRGTVTDISPGTKDPAIQMRFPKGVPAVSDGDMSDWMLYVYKQFERPMVSGVPVKLEVVVDPNGNWYDIGTTYTDSTGFYGIEWEPPVPGYYLILASFEGSEAYYPSYVETSILVDEGLTPGTLMETEFPSITGLDQSTTTPLISTEVAIFAVIAIASIIGLVAYSLIRKE
jgi:outer membrane protein assembly factor BamB